MKYLITGGAGFLGTNLALKLLEKKHEVISLDNLLTGTSKNVDFLKNYDDFNFIKSDIINPIDIEVDGVFNLACPASPPKYQIDPINTAKTCFNGTINMLELCRKRKIKIFHASTSEIYGNPLENPQNEDYFGNVNTFGPRACYDEGKRIAETLCFDFNKKYNVDIRIARIFNTYGPFMSSEDGRVISNFIVSALNNQPITIYGNGKQTRSFCYVNDLIDGIIKLFFSDEKINTPVNLGNPSEYNIESIANIIKDLTDSKSSIIYKDLPKDDPIQRRPDISKAKEIIKWEPKVDLLNGLNFTINYFSKSL